MKQEIFISIIAAGSALLGSLIPTVIGFLNNVNQNKFELDKTLLEKQKDIYWDLMVALQNMINNQDDDSFRELQKSVIKVSIYGDNLSSLALNKYYKSLTDSSMAGLSLPKEAHKQFQTEIINGMRSNLGLEPFESFEIVGYRPFDKILS